MKGPFIRRLSNTLWWIVFLLVPVWGLFYIFGATLCFGCTGPQRFKWPWMFTWGEFQLVVIYPALGLGLIAVLAYGLGRLADRREH